MMARCLVALVLFMPVACSAQESPYFVTYDHHMEEPGNLEIEVSTSTDIPRAGQRLYFPPWTEFEYGVTARWTTEVYLEGQSTWQDSTLFTGWRIENRFRPLKREHWINPVLYLEYENLNEADRIQKEIEGGSPDISSPNSVLRLLKDRELETKLILSSDVHDWNIAGNFIAAKNFSQMKVSSLDTRLAFRVLSLLWRRARIAGSAGKLFCRGRSLWRIGQYTGLWFN